MKTIIWYGLRRSGNHGLIYLLLLSSQKKYVFINDLKYLSYEKYQQCLEQDMTPFDISKNALGIQYVDLIKHACLYTGFKNAELVVLGFENKPLSLLSLQEMDKFPIADTYKVILFRNPFNNLASIYHKFEKNKELVISMIELWLQYANFIIHHHQSNNYIFLFYDKFYKDKEYQTQISQQLDVELNMDFDFNDENKIFMARSSFTQTLYSNNETNRYLEYINDDFFNTNVMQHKCLISVYKQLCEIFHFDDEIFSKKLFI